MLIVFTGIDGSGKSTQASLLTSQLMAGRHRVLYVYNRWEPILLRPIINLWKKKNDDHSVNLQENFEMKRTRKNKMLNNPILKLLWKLYFFIDYAIQILFRIRLRMRSDLIILSDRIFYDSLIDQAINLSKTKEWLFNILDSFWIRLIFPTPNLVIYFDCPEHVAFARKKDIPNIEYLKERRSLYLALAERYKWQKVDGTNSFDLISVEIRNLIYSSIMRNS
jgi:dTMP kinase